MTDHLGTPREMLSEDGKLQWAAEYRTWGSVKRLWRNNESDNDNFAVRTSGTGGIGSHGGSSNGDGGFKTTGVTYGNLALKTETQFQEIAQLCPIRFQGQYEDVETGLYYNRFRYYAPLAGQYISPDPIGIQGGLRPHGYVHNPNQWIDPLGLKDLPSGVNPLPDGGITFDPSLRHPTVPNNIVIPAQGSDYLDFAVSNEQAGFLRSKTPSDYTWHHQSYDPITNQYTMELVDMKTHASIGHSGGRAQFKSQNGVDEYGTPESKRKAKELNESIVKK